MNKQASGISIGRPGHRNRDRGRQIPRHPGCLVDE